MEQIPTNLVILVEVNSLSQFLEIRSPGCLELRVLQGCSPNIGYAMFPSEGLNGEESHSSLFCFVGRIHLLWASLVAQMVKNLPPVQETWVQSWVGKISWRRKQLPTPVFLPGEFHELRILVGYSAWSRKESDTTEQLTLSHFVFICLCLLGLRFLRDVV